MTILPKQWEEALKKTPETGAGFHECYIKFKNGKGLECYVLHCNIIDAYDFDPEMIADIVVLS
jgi:hypothetical protein